MAGKPTFLSLREFLKLRGEQKNPVIVYFDEKQWASLTRGLKPSTEKPPKTGAKMILTTLPGLSGWFVEFHCPIVTKITGAEGEVHCGEKHDTTAHPPDIEPVTCGILIRENGQLSCKGNCEFGTCRIRSYGVSFGSPGFPALLVLCQCY